MATTTTTSIVSSSTSSSKPILGYWDIRGVGQVIRNLLYYLDVDFVDRQYTDYDFIDDDSSDGGGGDNNSEDDGSRNWKRDKYSIGLDFPNLPYYIDGKVKLTQTLAILRYIARKYQLAGNTSAERLRISLMEQQVTDLNLAFYKLAYNENIEKLKPEYFRTLPEQLRLLSDYLATGPFVAGINISYVDFWLYEYLIKMKTFATQVLEQYDNLVRFIDRIESLPRLSSYVRKHKGTMWFGKPVSRCKWNAIY